MTQETIAKYKSVSRLLVFLFFILRLCPGARGKTLFVDDKVTTSGDGASFTRSKKTISEALAFARSGDAVWVAAGTYRESVILKSGVTLYGGFAGHETSPADRIPGACVTRIDAGSARKGLPAFHAVILDGIAQARIDGFTITGGRADGEGLDANGGGIFCRNLDETCSISRCLIIRNSARHYGGGVYWSPESPPRLEECAIEQNSAEWGAGVYCGGAEDPCVYKCAIRNNTGTGDFSKGGGIFSCGKARFESSTISANSASFGGGVYCHKEAGFLLCVFTLNTSSYGGAVYSLAETRFDHCTLTANSAFQGGGILSHKSKTLVRNSILWLNSGKEVYSPDVSPDIQNSCIENGFPGKGNISLNPLFMGWGEKTDLYIDAQAKNPGDGTPAFPFSDVQGAFTLYNLTLAKDSPCLFSAEGGASMGAGHLVGGKAGNSSIRFHIAPGEYDISHATFDWGVSVEGAGAEKTTMKGCFRGLKSGCSLKAVTVARSSSSGMIIPPGESPVVEECRIEGNRSQNLGGGVCLGSGSGATFLSCIITGNRSEKRGGGIYACEDAGGLFLKCTVQANSSGKDGGGAFLGPESRINFLDCSITDNATWHDGAALYCDTGSEPLLQSCLIRENASFLGAGGYCGPGSLPSFLLCRIISNHASYGAGIFCDASSAVFTGCEILKNNAWYGGGGYFKNGSMARFQDCRISFNHAKNGGGLYIHGAHPSLSQCRIFANTSACDGGGLYCFESDPLVSQCDFMFNNARSGGAIFSRKSIAQLTSSILWDNDGGEIYDELGGPRVQYSCVRNGWEGAGNISDDPGFVAWGMAKDIYIDSIAKDPADGAQTHPFPDIRKALSLYSENLGEDSPCVGTGEGGGNMGAGHKVLGRKGNSSVTFHIAPGEYDISDSAFSMHVSVEGGGAEQTILKGAFIGLRSGSSLRNVTVTGSSRGGIRIGAHQSPLVESCRITGNKAKGMYYNGGGVFCGSYARPVFKKCLVKGNEATEVFSCGGGGYCDEYSQPVFLECAIEKNKAEEDGGGIYCAEKSASLFWGCSLNENRTGKTFADGGGVFCHGASPEFTSCTLSANIAMKTGGGVACDLESQPAFTNCFITLNSAGERGGGFSCAAESNLLLANCTLYGNSSPAGGGFSLSHSFPIVRNSILWGSGGGLLENDRGGLRITYSDVEGGYEGKGNITADPLFLKPGLWIGQPGEGKWLDGDYRIQCAASGFPQDSSCMDAGDPGFEYHDGCRPPGCGTVRCDMGAYGGPRNCVESNPDILPSKEGRTNIEKHQGK